MKLTHIVDHYDEDDEPQKLSIIGVDFFSGEPIPELQIQIENGSEQAYIDLDVDDVVTLVEKLNEFIQMWRKK